MMAEEATFDEMWNDSEVFRNFFIGKYGYFFGKKLDWEKAAELWDNRFPRVRWCFCLNEGCKVLVPISNEFCANHSKKIPKWRLKRSRLWRLSDENVKRDYYSRGYRDYLLVVGKKIFGDIPRNYKIIKADGNPFNFRSGNLRLLSKISIVLVQAGVLSPAVAISFDREIVKLPFFNLKKSPPIRQAVFSYEDLARVCGKNIRSIYNEASLGYFDFDDLESVFQFIVDNKLERIKRSKKADKDLDLVG
jgi:hypothetical protein